jgi:hypothetical protein
VRDDVIAEHRRDNHLGRRTLVRVGATAAWTVPVIAMAAPAMAATCSGGSTTLTVVKIPGTDSQTGKKPTTRSVQVQLCNTGGSATCALSATVTGPGASSKLTSLTVGDWPGATSSGGADSLTVLAPAAGQLAHGECATYLVTFEVKVGQGQFTITFKTSNGGLATVSLTVDGD